MDEINKDTMSTCPYTTIKRIFSLKMIQSGGRWISLPRESAKLKKIQRNSATCVQRTTHSCTKMAFFGVVEVSILLLCHHETIVSNSLTPKKWTTSITIRKFNRITGFTNDCSHDLQIMHSCAVSKMLKTKRIFKNLGEDIWRFFGAEKRTEEAACTAELLHQGWLFNQLICVLRSSPPVSSILMDMWRRFQRYITNLFILSRPNMHHKEALKNTKKPAKVDLYKKKIPSHPMPQCYPFFTDENRFRNEFYR